MSTVQVQAESLADVTYEALAERGAFKGAGPTLHDIASAVHDSARWMKIDSTRAEATAVRKTVSERKWATGEPAFVSDTKANRRAGRRVTEGEIAEVIVEILEAMPAGRASIGELVYEIPRRLALSLADHVRAPSRPNEAVWQQQVRNVKSHRDSPGNAVYEGKLKIVKGGFALLGLRLVKKPPAQSVSKR